MKEIRGQKGRELGGGTGGGKGYRRGGERSDKLS